MFPESLSLSLPSFREYALVFMIILILLQFSIITLLVIYTILNRLWINHLREVQEEKNQGWYDNLFQYLDGEVSVDQFKSLVHVKDFSYFIEFIKEFFLDLAGNEKDKLKELLVNLGLESYLTKQLTHRNFWKRMHAAYFLGLMNCRRAIPELRKRIHDKSELVGLMAVSNLMQLKDYDSLSSIISHLNESSMKENQTQITIFLMEFGPEILPYLEQMFRNEPLEEWIKEVFLTLFGHYVYSNVTDEILKLLESTKNPELKTRCVSTLAEFEDPNLVETFERLLSDSPPSVQVHAVKALSKLGAESSVPKFLTLVQSENFWVAKRSIEALHSIGPAGVEKLMEILDQTQTKMTRDLILESLNE